APVRSTRQSSVEKARKQHQDYRRHHNMLSQKVARCIKKQTAIRKACVRLTSERINGSKDPFPTLSRLQLEDRAFAINAASRRRSVKKATTQKHLTGRTGCTV